MTINHQPSTVYQAFHFAGYDWNAQTKTLECHYALDEENFTERVVFDFDVAENLDQDALQAAFFGYFIMAGISYYKAGLPQKITFADHLPALSEDQAQFFTETYYHGLGELFYTNHITPFRPDFPTLATSPSRDLTNCLPLKSQIILPLGGGKDSLTSVQLLQDAGLDFQTWTVGNYPGLIPSLKTIHGDKWSDSHLKIKRTISPVLIELNQNGAINGHVPISSIWAFLSVITAVLTNQKYIAFSNESSANEPTLELNGESINHQYSKTLDFEKAFRHYAQTNIHPELEYFSLLRPLTELRIAEIFADKAWPRFHQQFSSCNRNFTQASDGSFFWCGKCPKCAFVFLILAPFVPPGELLKVFGKNMLSESALEATWQELLGLTTHKPFECVGTINEVKQAFLLAAKYYPEVAQWEAHLDLPDDFDFRATTAHCIPEAIAERVGFDR